jgi:hypothetical protein
MNGQNYRNGLSHAAYRGKEKNFMPLRRLRNGPPSCYGDVLKPKRALHTGALSGGAIAQ